jgi:hypothetical protein
MQLKAERTHPSGSQAGRLSAIPTKSGLQRGPDGRLRASPAAPRPRTRCTSCARRCGSSHGTPDARSRDPSPSCAPARRSGRVPREGIRESWPPCDPAGLLPPRATQPPPLYLGLVVDNGGRDRGGLENEPEKDWRINEIVMGNCWGIQENPSPSKR